MAGWDAARFAAMAIAARLLATRSDSLATAAAMTAGLAMAASLRLGFRLPRGA